MKLLLTLATAAASAHAYWLMGIEDFITTERIDPVVNPGKVSGHAHSVLGGSNFRFTTNTAALRQSQCTSIPIPQDKSAYWFPHLYFQWNNGSFSSLNGGAVIDTPGTTTAFPDDFRMISGDPTLRTYDPTSFAQQAVTFLCLDFNGVSTKHNELPAKECPSGIRAQINFPSCWDGKNVDSPDHKSHVAFLSTGPDSGSCSDPKFPVVLPRIFMEVYWGSADFDNVRSQARNTSQPFVYAHGDPTGYGYHADFINGWDAGVLQNAVDKCHCNPYGDATCCVDQGIFGMNHGQNCRITKAIDEQTTGTLLKLPGNNPVQPYGKKATMFTDNVTPPLISPIYAYTGNSPIATGSDTTPGQTQAVSSPVAVSSSSSSAVANMPTGTSAPATTPSSSVQASSPATTPAASSASASASASASNTQKPSSSSMVFTSISKPTISAPAMPTYSAPQILTVGSATPSSSSVPAVTIPSNPPVTRPSANPAQGPGVGDSSGTKGSSSGSGSNNNNGSSSPGHSGSSLSGGGSKSSSTCSSKKNKKRRAMEQHRRRAAAAAAIGGGGVTGNFASHVRHLDYEYEYST